MKAASMRGPLVVVLALTAPLAAQSTGRAFQRMSKPLRSATLDLGTGTITRGPSSRDRGGVTVAVFQNLDFSGFIGVDTGAGACKWFTAGLKGSGSNQTSASELMTNIVFGYCSAAKDVSSGGPGGSATLGFYEGYTLTGGAPTTAVAVLALTGLPASTASSTFLGGTRCFLLTVTFTDMIAFRDSGPGSHQGIGYSWTFDDLGTDGVLAATFPFMACVVSCSGSVGQIDGQGMTDAIDQYCPPGAAVPNTIWGSTVPGARIPFGTASKNMQIQEASDRLTTNVAYNATVTPNADTLTATTAIIGTTWSSTIVKAVPSAPSGFTVRIRANRSLPNGTPAPPPATGRVLIAGPLLAQLSGTHDGTTGSVSSPIPLQVGFCGVHFAAQSMTLGGGIKLSSAVEGTTGTF